MGRSEGEGINIRRFIVNKTELIAIVAEETGLKKKEAEFKSLQNLKRIPLRHNSINKLSIIILQYFIKKINYKIECW